MLKQFLEENPSDAFARYGLAMELAKTGDVEAALREYRRIMEVNPDYTPAYQMAGQMLVEAGRTDEARQYFQQGIASAKRGGNAHAQSEMQAMMDELG